MIKHVVLLGGSIFDNNPYVPSGTEVEAQLRSRLGAKYQIRLLARDGSVIEDMVAQVSRLGDSPGTTTWLLVSCGGNDVLGLVSALKTPVRTVLEATELLASWQARFRSHYQRMLDLVLSKKSLVAVSTIYDAIPGLAPGLRAALALFNDINLREAIMRHLPVLDLRLVCDESADYASSSPLEPSSIGGRKIAAAIAQLVSPTMFMPLIRPFMELLHLKQRVSSLQHIW